MRRIAGGRRTRRRGPHPRRRRSHRCARAALAALGRRPPGSRDPPPARARHAVSRSAGRIGRRRPAWLANADLADQLEALSRSYGADRAGRGFETVDRAVEALARNAARESSSTGWPCGSRGRRRRTAQTPGRVGWAPGGAAGDDGREWPDRESRERFGFRQMPARTAVAPRETVPRTTVAALRQPAGELAADRRGLGRSSRCAAGPGGCGEGTAWTVPLSANLCAA